MDKQLGATGHMLEFLSIALSDEEIAAPWVQHSAQYMCRLFRALEDEPLECGALYHAAHGLHLYRTRRFGPRSYANAMRSGKRSEATQVESKEQATTGDAPPPPL